jgi:6-phosphogluconolactonase
MRKQRRLKYLSALIILSLVAIIGCGGGGNPCSSGAGATGGPGGGPASGGLAGADGCQANGGNGGGGGGTGGGGSTTGINTLVYYLDASSEIQAANFNSSSGTFAALTPFTPAVLPSSSLNSMAIANSQFLYIPLNGFSTVEGFSITSTSGALTTISGSPFTAQAADDTITIDPLGRFLFVGGEFASSISVYQINQTTGALTPAPGSPFTSFNLVFANSLTVDGTGSFLYVGQSFSTSPVVAFSINQTSGALTEISGSPFSLGVSVLQADPSGKFLLGVADDTGTSGDHHIYSFSINPSTGAPTAVSGSPFATVSVPFALSMDPNGGFVYASMADSTGAVTNLEGFQLNATTGALTELPSSPFTTIPALDNCQFEQTGTFTFCTNASGFSVLGVDPTTGNLSHTIPDLTTTNNFPFAVTD